MFVVRRIRVPASLIRVTDYVFYGGTVVKIGKSRTRGLFPKSYIHLTFYTGTEYVDFTVESHIPVDIERVSEQVAQQTKEIK